MHIDKKNYANIYFEFSVVSKVAIYSIKFEENKQLSVFR